MAAAPKLKAAMDDHAEAGRDVMQSKDDSTSNVDQRR